MALIEKHLPLYREIFQLPGFFSEPFLTLGVQGIYGDNIPDDFKFADFKELLISKGVKNVKTLDLHDARADLRYDLNLPVPTEEHGRYSVVADIGTLEHVFDVKQCLESCIRMVKEGGLYFLHTNVNGYYNHGLYVFNPRLLVSVLESNHFEIVYLKYSTLMIGMLEIPDPSIRHDVLIWIVARKKRECHGFVMPRDPHQEIYDQTYGS